MGVRGASGRRPSGRCVVGALLAGAGIATASGPWLGCTPNREGEKPAERVSREIDGAVEATREALSDAAGDAQEVGADLVERTRQGLQEGQDRAREAMEGLRRAVHEAWRSVRSGSPDREEG